MFNQDNENKILEIDRLISDLEARNETLDAEIQKMLAEYKVNEEQLTAFITCKQNFSESNWAALQEEKKKIDLKLMETLRSIANPKQAQKNRQSLKDVQRNWLFVR